MSSLAASRADNFYYPPEWRPEYGGISKFQGSKGKNQYEQRGERACVLKREMNEKMSAN